MLTEDEAKGKMCPQAIAHLASGSLAQAQAILYGYPPSATINCVASACMAWRSPPTLESVATPDTLHAADFRQGNIMTPTPPEGAGWLCVGPYAGTPGWSIFTRQLPTDRGYCGLAGEPK